MNKQSLAQLISQLDTEGYCDISDKQVEALIRGFAALEEQRDALAAESAALKSFGDKLDRMRNDLNGEGTGIQGRAEVACQQIALEAALEEFDAIKAPVTDAFLAEVRAQGAEACVKALATSDDNDFTDAPNICACVAYQLRKGGAV